jgi:hypothetical protein
MITFLHKFIIKTHRPVQMLFCNATQHGISNRRRILWLHIMNCTNIVETTSYPAEHLYSAAYSAAYSYSQYRDHSEGYLTNHVGRSVEQQSTQCSFLEGIPYEILCMILEVMDIKSFWTFAAVKRDLRASVCSLWVIRRTQKSYAVSHALHSLTKADTESAFTIANFRTILMSNACTCCHVQNEFAPFLHLATCQRICFSCVQSQQSRYSSRGEIFCKITIPGYRTQRSPSSKR